LDIHIEHKVSYNPQERRFRMKISVIVPIYRVEKYIAQCAQTLFRQTYRDIEYIFVDDCSPDNSVSILKDTASKYSVTSFRIIRHDCNRGSGAARLTGLAHADGDFVAFVDSDDLLPERAFEALVKRQKETGADLIDGATDSFANDIFFDRQQPYKGKHYVEKLILQNVVPHHLWGRLIRRTLFTQHDIQFREGVNQAEDYSVIPRLAFHARRAWTDELVYHYRQDREGSFTDHISRRHVASFLEAHHIVVSFFKDKGRNYLYPLHVGLINASYRAVKAGISEEDVCRALDYQPMGFLFKTAAFFLARPSTTALARIEYLILKRLYLTVKS